MAAKDFHPKSPPRLSNGSTPRHSPPERSAARMPDRSTPTPYQEEDIHRSPIALKVEDLPVPQDKVYYPQKISAVSSNKFRPIQSPFHPHQSLQIYLQPNSASKRRHHVHRLAK